MMFPWAVLRALAEGRIRWAFCPPGTDPCLVQQQGGADGAGIWVPDLSDAAHDVDVESDGDVTAPYTDEGSQSDAAEDESEEEAAEPTSALASGALSRFAALSLDNELEGSDGAED